MIEKDGKRYIGEMSTQTLKIQYEKYKDGLGKFFLKGVGKII
ncbi:MAG: hypothetical protein SFU27_02610 [Thermonemataceae bacterium]|nr:hypothetical protein [Thermonemataceae bacterium]